MRPALAIHGGAGTILRLQMTVDLEREYRNGLETALRAGWSVLESGGSAVDAVEAAVVSLEDFPLFNAGRGAVFTHDGRQEMDACIMDGSRLRAGAVAAVEHVKNPIKLARLVMQKTQHVLLAGDGAAEFAHQQGVEFESDEYFFTEHRWLQLQHARAEGVVELDHTVEEIELLEEADAASPTDQHFVFRDQQKGTVGAVACDSQGRLAAATSTGGMTNKKFGRVGDTPLVGLGTYADEVCAVSGTGHGEFFMVGVTAYDVSARMKYKSISLADSARETIDHLTKIGGEGGLICVDAQGNVTLPFNSAGMYRGYIRDGRPVTEIYR
ncbi:MAG: isoaspartyl peptidase/L-asparaginase family protein [Pyrinomonadaceae bacterium]